jgi:hypothetical protein
VRIVENTTLCSLSRSNTISFLIGQNDENRD